MPERSFGRTIRYRRTKMGLSQAKLGELVGRSPSTIRSWERDNSLPNEPAVIDAVAAVLGIDRGLLYEKADVDMVAVETSPTVEEALATLGPVVETKVETASTLVESRDEPETEVTVGAPVEEDSVDDEGLEGEPEAPPPSEHVDDSESGPSIADPELEEALDGEDEEDGPPLEAAEDERVPVLTPAPPRPSSPQPVTPATPRPGYIAPRDNLVYSQAAARSVEPSYIEDGSQRQLYRIRALATVVFMVAIVVVLLWATSNAWDSLTTWWSDFFGSLRL